MSADTADSLWMVIRCCGNPYGDENQINSLRKEHIICQKTLLSTVHWLHISDLCMQNKTHKTLNRHSAFAAKNATDEGRSFPHGAGFCEPPAKTEGLSILE